MQVACSKCNAQYDFEASAIPPGGYDAQCTTCNNVFFVAPEPTEAQLSVSCGKCGAVYQFPVSAIPPGGYDAQCTQCQAVFFVSANPAPEAAAAPATVADAAPIPTAPAAPHTTVADATAIGNAETEIIPKPAIAAAPAEAAEAVDEEPILLDPTDEPVEPTPLGVSATPAATSAAPDDDDVTAALGKRRTGLWLALGAVVLLGGSAGVVQLTAPRLVARLLGKAEDPAVRSAVSTARTRLLDDTDAGYAAMLGALEPALATSPEHAEALALQALAHLFRGLDAKARAGEQPADAAAATLAEKDLAAAQRALTAALAAAPEAVLPHLAAGLHAALVTPGGAKAGEALKKVAELQAHAAPGDAAGVLLAYLRARGGESAQLKDGLQAATSAAPTWPRPRFELALELDKAGAREEARKLLEGLVATAPAHDKSRRVLERWSAQAAAVAPAPPAPEVEKAEPPRKGKKGKKRKGKRRR